MSTRKPKSVLEQDRYTAELSTGQLVIGVCILLMFGLGCFLLGVLIGKFDPSLHTRVAAQESSKSPSETATSEVKVSPPPAQQPARVTPEQTPQAALPPEMRVPPRILAEESAAAQQPAAGTASSTPQAASPTETPPPVAAPQKTDVAETVQAAAEKNRLSPPGAQPQPVNDVSSSKPAPSTDTPKKQPSPSVAKTAARPASPKSAKAPAAAAGASWGVQIAAVGRERADKAKREVEAKSPYKAMISYTRGNSLAHVVVGPYPDRASANKARDDLQTRYHYSGAFVVSLP